MVQLLASPHSQEETPNPIGMLQAYSTTLMLCIRTTGSWLGRDLQVPPTAAPPVEADRSMLSVRMPADDNSEKCSVIKTVYLLKCSVFKFVYKFIGACTIRQYDGPIVRCQVVPATVLHSTYVTFRSWDYYSVFGLASPSSRLLSTRTIWYFTQRYL